ncbi:MAG: hypothetical protein ACRDRY_12220 [Pseudonocardiaceae bacterium]
MTSSHQDRVRWRCQAGDVGITLSAPQEWADVQRLHLCEYLPPTEGGDSVEEFRLDVYTDGDLPGQMTRAASRTTATLIETIPGLALRRVQEAGGWQCFTVASDAVEGRPGAWAARSRGRELELFLRDGSPQAHRYPLRLIREAMLRTHENHGGIIFHAAAANLHGTGVMVCGPRGAGKTTTLACLLRAGGMLLSNDRVILHGRERLVAVPLPVPVARGTLDAFPELADSVEPSVAATLPDSFGSLHKVAISARQFATTLGAAMIPTAKLRLIVLPRLTDTREPARGTRVRPQQARDVLSQSCFTPHDEFWIRPWLVARTESHAALAVRARELVDDLAKSVPCVVVHCGVRNPAGVLQAAVLDALNSVT